jgi:hypothetical protein
VGPDGSTATATSTATGTATAAQTSSSTTTSTATGTYVSPEPRPDGAPPITVADAATLDVIPDLPIRVDAVASRDGAVMDAVPGAVDTTVNTPASDAPIFAVSDGGVVLADAAAGTTRDTGVVGRDGGQMGAPDDARGDGAAAATKASGGCGCAIGGGNTGPAGFWPLLALGFLALWRGGRGARRHRRRVDRD